MDLMFFSSQNLLFGSNTQTELLAIRHRLMIAADRNFKPLLIETDSEVAISMFKFWTPALKIHYHHLVPSFCPLLQTEHRRLSKFYQKRVCVTNMQAEILALRQVLQLALELNVQFLEIHTDSQVLADCSTWAGILMRITIFSLMIVDFWSSNSGGADLSIVTGKVIWWRIHCWSKQLLLLIFIVYFCMIKSVLGLHGIFCVTMADKLLCALLFY